MQSARHVAKLAGCTVQSERRTTPGLELSDTSAAHLLFLLLSLDLLPARLAVLLPGLLHEGAEGVCLQEGVVQLHLGLYKASVCRNLLNSCRYW